MINATLDCPSSINTTIPYDGELRGFDIDYAADQFRAAMSNSNAITLHHYLLGFRELLKFFYSLGPLFLFVTSDLETKIGLLESYRRSDQGLCDPAYLTLQSAIEYEREKDLLTVSDRPSAARTILRLHRALEFVSAFMLGISKLGEEEDTSSAAREAYSRTLAKHHGWTVRTVASLAMKTLPQKGALVEKSVGKSNSNDTAVVNQRVLRLSEVTESLFKIVDKFYDEQKLQDLP